jgi:hypothetical protein
MPKSAEPLEQLTVDHRPFVKSEFLDVWTGMDGRAIQIPRQNLNTRHHIMTQGSALGIISRIKS